MDGVRQECRAGRNCGRAHAVALRVGSRLDSSFLPVTRFCHVPPVSQHYREIRLSCTPRFDVAGDARPGARCLPTLLDGESAISFAHIDVVKCPARRATGAVPTSAAITGRRRDGVHEFPLDANRRADRRI